jgi:transcriptional regulator with XRE-family HTH domain
MITINMQPILQRLVKARKNAGLSQSQAARLVGLSSASSFSPIEDGTIAITLKRFLTLCDIYDIDLTWALTGVNPHVDVEALKTLTSRVWSTQEEIESLIELLSSMKQEVKP